MRIETEVKLDYKDVLFRPKRSTLASRSQVELVKMFRFKHSGQIWCGVPIVAANMDSVGTFETAKTLRGFSALTCLHKFYKTMDVVKFFEEKNMLDFTAVSSGISDEDLTDFHTVLSLVPQVKFICLDVANGYSENFVKVVERARRDYPEKIIIAGNVVTAEMTEELILKGADIVKVGIGGGCFISGTKIKTVDGVKNIEEIREGESVMTHTGEYQKVSCLFSKDEEKELVKVNETLCTANHEFYVVHKKHEISLTDENIRQYAEWISAEELTDDYYLLEYLD